MDVTVQSPLRQKPAQAALETKAFEATSFEAKLDVLPVLPTPANPDAAILSAEARDVAPSAGTISEVAELETSEAVTGPGRTSATAKSAAMLAEPERDAAPPTAEGKTKAKEAKAKVAKAPAKAVKVPKAVEPKVMQPKADEPKLKTAKVTKAKTPKADSKAKDVKATKPAKAQRAKG